MTDGDATALRGFSTGPNEVPDWLKAGNVELRGPFAWIAGVREWAASIFRSGSKHDRMAADRLPGLSDRDRLLLCYMKWAEVKPGGTQSSRHEENPGAALRDALTKAYEAFGAIEGALMRVGRRADAKRVHLARQKLVRDRERGRWSIVWPSVKWVFGDGARNWVPFLWVMAFWLVVFPAVFAGAELVHHGQSAAPASSVDSVVFSIANALTISVGDLQTDGFWGGVAQILDTALLYGLFGVARTVSASPIFPFAR